MKKIIFAVAIVVAVASCTSRQSTDQTKVLAAFKDSVEYADYLKWKKEQPTMQVVQREKETKIIYRDAATSTVATKKGWSKAAKGTVIGGAGGAVLGAIVNKRNRGAGAVVGGVIGAGAGYGIGRAEDRKDGRVRN